MKKIIVNFIVFISLVSLLSACAELFATDIQKIVDSPQEYADKEVTVAGTVKNVTNLALLKYYKVEDKTGEIHVITKSDLPAKGEKVVVSGKVNPVFKIGTVQFTVIEEVPKRD